MRGGTVVNKVLNPNELRFYKKNGYLKIENVFSPEECNRVLEIAKQYMDKDFATRINLDRIDPVLFDVIRDQHIVKIVEAVQNSKIDAIMTGFGFKQAQTLSANQAWNPHQDNSYILSTQGGSINANLFLADSDPKNGGMYFYPGTHREPLLPSEPTPSNFDKFSGNNPGNTVQIPLGYKKIDITIGKGGLLLLHNHVIHGSYSNNSPTRSRPMFSITYCNKKATFAVGKFADRKRISVY